MLDDYISDSIEAVGIDYENVLTEEKEGKLHQSFACAGRVNVGALLIVVNTENYNNGILAKEFINYLNVVRKDQGNYSKEFFDYFNSVKNTGMLFKEGLSKKGWGST